MTVFSVQDLTFGIKCGIILYGAAAGQKISKRPEAAEKGENSAKELNIMNRIIKKAAVILLAIAFIFAEPSCMRIRRSYAAEAVSAIWPLNKSFQKITTYFDPMRNENDVAGYHNAIDVEADYGADIFAPRSGKCISAEWMEAYGNMVILYHEDLGIYTFYAHCSSMDVTAGQAVSGGDVIGHVGSTGQSSGNHLHFGICDKLLSGWPCRTYYDPLTYFTFDGTAVAPPSTAPTLGESSPSCDCTTDYAGKYTTKNVVTYLNIRAGHSADTSALGQIPAGSQFTVTKGNGKWAHVEYNGISGYVSMDFITKVADAPAESCKCSESYAGTYTTTGVSDVLNIRADHSASAKLLGTIPANATFKVTKADGSWAHIEYNGIIGFVSMTYIKKVEEEKPKATGDLNNDSKVGIADAVVMQNYLLGGTKLTEEQYAAADMNSDKSVDTFDLIIMRKKLVEELEKNAETKTW